MLPSLFICGVSACRLLLLLCTFFRRLFPPRCFSSDFLSPSFFRDGQELHLWVNKSLTFYTINTLWELTLHVEVFKNIGYYTTSPNSSVFRFFAGPSYFLTQYNSEQKMCNPLNTFRSHHSICLIAIWSDSISHFHNVSLQYITMHVG